MGQRTAVYTSVVIFSFALAAQYAKASPSVYALEHLTAAAVSDTEIDLSWTAITETPPTTGYKIERETPIGGGFTTITVNTGSAGASYADTNLSPNTVYRYRVTALNSDGYGPPSSDSYGGLPSAATKASTAVYVPPADPPTNLILTPTSGSDVTISWTAPPANENITAYKIDRSVGGGFGPFVSSTADATASYTDSNLSPGGTYGYRVYSISALGMSGASPAAYVTMPLPPSGLNNVRAVAGDGQVTVSWSPAYSSVGGVTGYTVTGSGNVSVSLPNTATSTIVTGLTNGASYIFTVGASNAAGFGPTVSTYAVVPATTTVQIAPPPAAPIAPPPPLFTPAPLPPAASPSPTSPASATGFRFTSLLQQGMRGAAVTALQNRLTSAGVYSGPITGYFGALTKAAVIAYQKAHALSQVGFIGPLTRASLNAGL